MTVPVNLSVPDDLGPALLKEAATRETTIQGAIVAICAEYFGIEVPLPQRGRPPKTEDG